MHFKKFISFALVAGGFAFGAAFVEKLPLHILATATVVVYWLVLNNDIRKLKDGHSQNAHLQHPESVYIVGYIATIGGFAGLAVYLGRSSGGTIDFKTALPMILERGGFAVVSTLVGLVAMNVLKMQADVQAGNNKEQEEFAQRIASEISKSLGNAEQTAEFTKNMAQMASEMAGNVNALNQMQTTAREVEGVMQLASQQMPQLVCGMERFEELTSKVLPAWAQITDQTAEAARLNAALANSAESMEKIQAASGSSAESLKLFSEALKPLPKQFSELLDEVRKRLESLNRFGDELTRFLEYAREAGPILTTVRGGFEDIAGIGENLKLLSATLLRVNGQLLTFQTDAVAVKENTDGFGQNIGNLSVQISTAVRELARLTEPMKRIGEMAEQAASASQWFEGHATGLGAFRDNLTGLVSSAEALKGAVTETKDAVTSSAITLKELQELMPRLASARASQFEKL